MDEITGRVLAEMEEVCDKYFVEIKEKTIKVRINTIKHSYSIH